jgi:hypothetical protein
MLQRNTKNKLTGDLPDRLVKKERLLEGNCDRQQKRFNFSNLIR